jgi:ankyrin repeat protein
MWIACQRQLLRPIAAAIVCFAAGCARDEGMSSLMIAAHGGDLAAVESAVKKPGEVNRTSAYGWTPLMFAAWQGHAQIVRVLLDAGADPNHLSGGVPSRFETVGGHPPTTALREAMRADHQEIAALLLQRGAKPDGEALAIAAGNGQRALVEAMLATGLDINTPSANAFEPSAVCSAAAAGDTMMLEWLLARGANPSLIAVGQYPLGEAAKNNHPECVRVLLEHGAKPNERYGVMDESALFEAVAKYTRDDERANHLEVLRLLVAGGADPAMRVWKGKSSPLEMARHYRAQAMYPQETDTDATVRAKDQAYADHAIAAARILDAAVAKP